MLGKSVPTQPLSGVSHIGAFRGNKRRAWAECSLDTYKETRKLEST